MKKFKMIIVLIWSIVWVVSCGPYRSKKDETIQKFDNTTGDPIAVDYLIKKYEKEHKKFYDEEIGDGYHLKWLALDKKNLSEYCKKYIQCSVPGRQSDKVTGYELKGVLRYKKENMRNSNIVLVHCKIRMIHVLSYYIIQAPEPNCVYTVKRANTGCGKVFTIVNKQCDLEERSLKRKKAEINIGRKDHQSGQPIAKDKYLLDYELEHQEFLKIKSNNGESSEWPYTLDNLDSYCYQYISECAPGRQREGIKGIWKTDKLQYQKLNINEKIQVTIVTCTPQNASKVTYYISEAPEKSCVYALLRKSRSAYSPLLIIFKHCDFESPNNLKSNSQNYNAMPKNLFPITEIKDETFDTLEIKLLFPNN